MTDELIENIEMTDRVINGHLNAREAVTLAGKNQPLHKMVWKMRKEAKKSIEENDSITPHHIAAILRLEARSYENGGVPHPGEG